MTGWGRWLCRCVGGGGYGRLGMVRGRSVCLFFGGWGAVESLALLLSVQNSILGGNSLTMPIRSSIRLGQAALRSVSCCVVTVSNHAPVVNWVGNSRSPRYRSVGPCFFKTAASRSVPKILHFTASCSRGLMSFIRLQSRPLASSSSLSS